MFSLEGCAYSRESCFVCRPQQAHKKCWQVLGGEACPQEGRDREVRTQLEIQDAEGRNLAMLAAQSGNVAILKAVMAEIRHTRVSKRVLRCWPRLWGLRRS